MKKFIYSALLALIVSMSFYSCTEEQIKPKAESPVIGGGGVIDPMKKS